MSEIEVLKSKEVKHRSVLYLIIMLLMVSFAIQRCHFEGKTKQTIVIPPISNNLEKKTPTEIKHDTLFSETIKYNNKTILIQNPVNMEMVEKYIRAKDSIEQLNMYLNSIQIRKYSEEWEDDNIMLKVEAETTGSLNYLKPSYTIKEKTIEVDTKQKEVKFALLAGGGLKYNLDLNNTSPTVNVGYRNKKGNVVFAQYGLDKSMQLNYSFQIFNIKK